MRLKLMFILLFVRSAIPNGVPFELCFYHTNGIEEYIQCGPLQTNRNNYKLNGLSDIEKIYIGWNSTMLKLNYGLFASFIRLKVLYLINAKIETVDKRSLYNMEQLKELSFYNNNIAHLDSTTFNYLPVLKILNLGSNKLISLEKYLFHNLLNLEELILSWNKLQFLSKDTFYGLKKLHKLDLQGNTLKLLHVDVFNNLKTLVNLDLSYNGIKQLHFKLFECQTNLEVLNLGSNSMIELPEKLFDTTFQLQYLDISDNYIKSVNGSILQNAVVEIFKLERNLITNINASELLAKAQWIEEVYLDHNPWSCSSLQIALNYFEESQIYIEPGINIDKKNVNGILCY